MLLTSTLRAGGIHIRLGLMGVELHVRPVFSRPSETRASGAGRPPHQFGSVACWTPTAWGPLSWACEPTNPPNPPKAPDPPDPISKQHLTKQQCLTRLCNNLYNHVKLIAGAEGWKNVENMLRGFHYCSGGGQEGGGGGGGVSSYTICTTEVPTVGVQTVAWCSGLGFLTPLPSSSPYPHPLVRPVGDQSETR